MPRRRKAPPVSAPPVRPTIRQGGLMRKKPLTWRERGHESRWRWNPDIAYFSKPKDRKEKPIVIQFEVQTRKATPEELAALDARLEAKRPRLPGM
jgi:hypothetical protein